MKTYSVDLSTANPDTSSLIKNKLSLAVSEASAKREKKAKLLTSALKSLETTIETQITELVSNDPELSRLAKLMNDLDAKMEETRAAMITRRTNIVNEYSSEELEKYIKIKTQLTAIGGASWTSDLVYSSNTLIGNAASVVIPYTNAGKYIISNGSSQNK